VVAIGIAVNFFYYRNLYRQEMNYITGLLEKQTLLVGGDVEKANATFISDINRLNFDTDIPQFFTSPASRFAVTEKLKLFSAKYDNFVTEVKLYDTNRNEYTLKKDPETGEWLEQSFELHIQNEVFERERLVNTPRKYEYYMPLIVNGEITGNAVVSVDYVKYFTSLFDDFNLKDYQWQWVVDDSGTVIFNNFGAGIEYRQLGNIIQGIHNGSVSFDIHSAQIDGQSRQIISAYYSTQLLQRNIGIVFSTYTDFFQKNIARNSLFVVTISVVLVQLIISILIAYIRRQRKTMEQLAASEKLLFSLIDELPVGIIIHNKNREIIKANRIAARQYAYDGENEMTGKVFLEPSMTEANRYLSKNPSVTLAPEQLVVVKKEIGETLLCRRSLPITINGQEATLEMLLDISAGGQNMADIAQSEFLQRMSYEIKTPLNGIIGMADILAGRHFSGELGEVITLMYKSAEILLKIVNDIFDFSKIEQNNIILEEVPFNLHEELEWCAATAGKMMPASVKFNFSIDGDIPKTIIGDRFRLRQILINLINHSIANTNDGRISLTCKPASIERGVVTLLFTLADTGVPFDTAAINKVFGEHIIVNVNNTDTGNNTVFGSIIAKRLIEMMMGKIYAESPSGLDGSKGLKVTFSIPGFTAGQQAKNVPFSNITAFSHIKALAITGARNRDDETLGYLHRIGIDLKITTFHKSTISQIKNNIAHTDSKYNLVVIYDDTDINGFDVAAAIWDEKLSLNFILFIIAAKDKRGNYLRCATMGVDRYLVRPFEITELTQHIRALFPEIEAVMPHGINKSSLRVLVVEDNPMAQRVTGAMLKFLGYSFDTADDGYEACRKAGQQKYDLVIIDILMPGMDGFEAAQRITELNGGTVIVATSATARPDMTERLQHAGINEFLPKPVRIDDIKKVFAKYFKA
jgi:signal transduction histidine kinase/CheY-like chemotaxis protein